MPFIGQQPITGAYSVLDDITTSATATYNLQLNSAAYSPASANNLLVSLNGVIQKPGSSFTISGSQITFSSALTSSDSIDFIIALGDVLSVGTPTDGSVSTASLAPSAVTDAKISAMAATKLTGTVSNARFPAGTVIQTKDYQVSQFYVAGSNANTAFDCWTTSTISGGALPTFSVSDANNKVRITWHHQPLIDGDDQQMNIILYDSTNGGSSWSQQGNDGGFYFGNNTGTSFTRQHYATTASYIYTPGHTNTITYKMTISCNANNAYYYHIGNSAFSRIYFEEIVV